MGKRIKGCDDALAAGIKLNRIKGKDADKIIDDLESKFKKNKPTEEQVIHTELTPPGLAQEFLFRNNLFKKLFSYQDQFYEYNGRNYHAVPDYEMSARLIECFQKIQPVRNKLGTKLIKDIEVNVKSLVRISPRLQIPCFPRNQNHDAKNLVNFRNGILNLKKFLKNDEGGFIDHTPELFSLSSLPFDFNPKAKSKLWKKLLSEILPSVEEQEFLQEWFGYNLIFDTSQEKFMIFLGEGANGKSMCLCVLRCLLGSENISGVNLEAFSPTNRFALSSTVGKLANIVEELNEMTKVEEGELKKFITGAEITVERKYKPHFNFRPTARLTWSTNILPTFTDRSRGIWRRLLLLNFKTTIPEEKQNKNYLKSDFWVESNELPGITNWALEGLGRLLNRGHFEEPTFCRELKTKFQVESNPSKSFLLENYREAAGPELSSLAVYSEYTDWAKNRGYHPLNQKNFSQEIRRTFPTAHLSENAVKLYHGGRGHVWTGIQSV